MWACIGPSEGCLGDCQPASGRWWEQDSNLRSASARRFYRPLPLTTRPSHPSRQTERTVANRDARPRDEVYLRVFLTGNRPGDGLGGVVRDFRAAPEDLSECRDGAVDGVPFGVGEPEDAVEILGPFGGPGVDDAAEDHLGLRPDDRPEPAQLAGTLGRAHAAG